MGIKSRANLAQPKAILNQLVPLMPMAQSKYIILLKLPLLAEPDKQRFSQFVMKCLGMLNISLFIGASKLPGLMASISADCCTDSDHINLYLILSDNALYLCTGKSGQQAELSEKLKGCYQQSENFIVRLSEIPSEEKITEICETLRSESEVSDPELLRQHNERIQNEMKKAQERATQEFLKLEEKLAVKRNELQESIRAAEIDSLTQIYNRGAYDRRLHDSVKHCQRQGNLLSLILLDLDYFKEVNDTLGHQAGDEVLKNMAKYMIQYTRKDVDHVCRMGGDEFAIIFFSEPKIANRAAEKILTSMDGKVSIGIGQLRSDDTVESLVARTDAALYEAKERGRGQVVIDSELNNSQIEGH